MGYRIFGGGSAEVANDLAGNATGGVKFTVYDAAEGGSQVTDLLSLDGQPLPGQVESDSAPANPNDLGRVYFQAPDSYSVLFLDRGYGERWAIMAREIGTLTGLAIERSNAAYAYMQDLSARLDPEGHVYAPAVVEGRTPARTFDVDYFGAKGDGLTDDTPAVQAALDASTAAGGGVVTFSPGRRYLLHGTGIVGSNTHLVGYGATLIKNASSPAYAFFAILSGGLTGYGSGGRNIRLSGIECRGDLANERGVCLVAMHHADGVLVEQCSVIGGLAGGHALDLAACRHVTVTDSVFAGRLAGSHNAEAIQPDASRDGSLSYPDAPGSYDGLPSVDVTVTRCRFTSWASMGVTYPAPMAFGTHTAPPSGLRYADLTFTDNYVEGADSDTTGYSGVLHFVAAERIRVAGNTFDNTAGSDVYMIATYSVADPTSGVLVRCSDVTIDGNTFLGRSAGGVQRTVHLREADRIKFINNNLRGVGVASYVVLLRDATRFLVTGNDWAADPAAGSGSALYVMGTSSMGTVERNIVTGFATPIGQDAGQTKVTLGTNITDGP